MRLLIALLVSASAQAQNYPPLNAEQQQAKEMECRAAGGQWSRFGVRDHLCGVYSCAERTGDAGKPCRSRADCEHLCVTNSSPRIGAKVVGECTAVKTTFN